MPDSRQVNINLIGKPKGNLTQNFLKWSVNIGRIIIITTELVALGALLYRFTIDRKIIDLHDQIERAELFVREQEAKEADYRSIHGRLINIQEIERETNIKVDILNDILEFTSQGSFSTTNLTVNQNRININGVAFSIFPLNNFIEELKENPNVASINLDEIASVNEGIQFKLNIELNQEVNDSS